jgi:hypothetical protein
MFHFALHNNAAGRPDDSGLAAHGCNSPRKARRWRNAKNFSSLARAAPWLGAAGMVNRQVLLFANYRILR